MKESLENLKEKEMKAEMSQRSQTKKDQPTSDLYSEVEKNEDGTGIERPTEEAVEEAMEWSEENRM